MHFTQGVHSRFALGFIASVIRYEIEDASRKSGHATNDLINEMNLLEMTNINGTYAYVHTENRRQLQLLENLGANSDLLDGVVCDENNRLNGRTVVPRHRKPGPKKKFKNVPNNNSERKKPGPQKGYRHGAVSLTKMLLHGRSRGRSQEQSLVHITRMVARERSLVQNRL